jgi:hypothetical protein
LISAGTVYPEFEPVTPGERAIVMFQARKLSRQLGISIPADRVLCAPWIGRIRGTGGRTRSVATSLGWLRSERKYWTKFRDTWSADYHLLGTSHKITISWTRRFNWPRSLVGQNLVHHHIDNGPYVVPIPKSLHERLSGTIHARATVLGT